MMAKKWRNYFLVIFASSFFLCNAKVKTNFKSRIQADQPITTESTDYEESENGGDSTDYPDENRNGIS